MSKKVRTNTNPRQVIRLVRKIRIRKKLVRQKGKIARLVVYRSNKFLYAQIIDDLAGLTLVQANTREKDFPTKAKKNLESAKALGLLIGKRATEKKLEKVVFDRNGYDFHGRIKAVADGAREAGLVF
jgi:large subunit ribosomal protein L18